MRKKSGFTLVEILVSAVIFALLIVGLLSVFASGNRLMTHARERITGTELGRFFIDPMQMDVRQDTWNSNSLDLSASPVALTSQEVNNRDFSANYTVADGNSLGVNYDSALAGTDLRRVTTKIIWTEPSP